MIHDCKYETTIRDMRDDIKSIKKDVRTLLEFKWKLLGVYGTIMFFGTLSGSAIVTWILKKI
jgi:hypothetical protein